jgi:hypothetical protein
MWGTRLIDFTRPVSSYTAKRKLGRIRRLIVPSPQQFHPRCYVWHLGDAADVNLICAARKPVRYARQGVATKKRHKEHDVKIGLDAEGNERTWHSLRSSHAYLKELGVAKITVQRWRNKTKCRFLGRTISTRKFKVHGRWEKYSLEDDLALILNLANATATNGTDIYKPAEKDTGVPRQIIAKLLKGAEPNKETIDKIACWGKQMSITEAAEFLEVSERGDVVGRLIESGWLTVLEDPFDLRSGRISIEQLEEVKKLLQAPDISITDAKENLISPEDVAKLLQVDRANVEQLIAGGSLYKMYPKLRDSIICWLPLTLAKKRYPKTATDKVLYKYADEPCPQLENRTLRAKRFDPREPILKQGAKTCLKWAEPDLMDLEPAEVGKPGQEAARDAREHPAPMTSAAKIAIPRRRRRRLKVDLSDGSIARIKQSSKEAIKEDRAEQSEPGQDHLPDLSDSMKDALELIRSSSEPISCRTIATAVGVDQGTVRKWCMRNGPLWLYGIRNTGHKQGYHYNQSLDRSVPNVP